MDLDDVVSDWQKRGFSCDIWTDAPGQVWANYVHPADELVMLIEGEIELRFAGRVERPAKYEEVLIPAGESHTVINTGTTVNRWYYGYRQS